MEPLVNIFCTPNKLCLMKSFWDVNVFFLNRGVGCLDKRHAGLIGLWDYWDGQTKPQGGKPKEIMG